MSVISPFSRDLGTSQGEEDGEDEAEVRNSYLLHLLRPNSRRARTKGSFLMGWSDPRFTLGTEPCTKVGSLQPISLPFRVHPAHFVPRKFLSFRDLLGHQGEREGDG